jgi:hypothetical protein
LQVLEDEEASSVGRHDPKESQDGFSEHDDRVVRSFDARVSPLGYEATESGSERQQFGILRWTSRPNRGAQRFGKWAKRNGTRALYRPPSQNEHSRVLGGRGGLASEPGFPDAGLTNEEQRLAVSGAGMIQRGSDAAQLAVASDHGGAQQCLRRRRRASGPCHGAPRTSHEIDSIRPA